MNAVEIEEAISALAEQPFDAAEFPFAFLEAFGNKSTTIKRLRTGVSNRSDINGVLQANNVHIKVCEPGNINQTLLALKNCISTTRAKAKFVLATDGIEFHAEDLNTGDVIVCNYAEFPEHFGFFLPLAGISTVKQIRESSFDIKATGRLNRLYVELLKNNSDWETAERRHDMNHFMARLIFCFFAEDTGIFAKPDMFTETINTMSATDSSNTHEVIGELFRTMNTTNASRLKAKIARWACTFPYVNGRLFSHTTNVPRFSKIARSYLLHIGNLDWTRINPDIFGSMIQAVADDEERDSLGMHYTSVPNILKVLNPLFLNELREKLKDAGENHRKLLNLRTRIARIRVFDPACGSGNFLVVAYKEMRSIEAEINKRREESDRRTEIHVTNFRGIELRDFPAEIARLALIIAEYQCNTLYLGQKEALVAFLPLDEKNWITCGNALRIDWLSICPPTSSGVKVHGDDLFQTPLNQAEIDFKNAGGETYICGNPPYIGDKKQSAAQKADLKFVSGGRKNAKAIDYVAGWIWKASNYISMEGAFAFVTTSSICQGVQVPVIWPEIYERGQEIFFAHSSFNWSNNASNNANVICVIVGVRNCSRGQRYLFDEKTQREVSNINAYLVDGPSVIIQKHSTSISNLPLMVAGNIPRDKANFMLTPDEKSALLSSNPGVSTLVRKIQGSKEFIDGIERYCLWIPDELADFASSIPKIGERLKRIVEYRRTGSERGKLGIDTPHRFERTIVGEHNAIIIPRVSSQRREYLPVGLLDSSVIVSDAAQAIYDAPLFIISIISSRLHITWTALTAGRMGLGFRYSSGVCYNSFPMPRLTEKNKVDLTRCAEDILLVRESHFPATIADLYGPGKMPDDLWAAHGRTDEVLERIYIGRRFKNDSERLDKLFELYIKMTTKVEKD